MTDKSEEGKTLDNEKRQEEQADKNQNGESSQDDKQNRNSESVNESRQADKNKEQQSSKKSEDSKSKSSKSSKSAKTKEQKSKKTKEQKKIEELEAKVQEQEQRINEQKDKFLRLYAEFENFRRRTSKEKTELTKTAGERIISKLLPVMDDYERAQAYFQESQDLEKFKEGIELIADKFWKAVKQEGLEEIESTNKEFNTDEHEAITKMPAPSEDMKGKVIDTTEKGYKLNGKVIRFAKVVVGN